MDIVVRFTCSVKNLPFDVRLREKGKRAVIVSIEPVKPRKFWQKAAPAPPAKTQEIDAVDWSRFICPWCEAEKAGRSHSWWCPRCQDHVCMGGSKVEDGKLILGCHCGAGGLAQYGVAGVPKHIGIESLTRVESTPSTQRLEDVPSLPRIEKK